MRLKTYFASSVEAAILLALEQLGPEAMIVNSRQAAPDHRYLGEYEVVFAVAPEDEPGLPDAGHSELTESAAIDSGAVGNSDAGPVRRLQSEVSRLASEIESLGRVMKRTEANQKISSFEGEQIDVAHSLREAGFSEEFVLEILSDTAADGGSLRSRVLQSLAERLKSTPSLGRVGHGRKVVALVGPAGAGKSALVAKLATRFGVAARRPCQILSLDSDRIGAAEPLRMVAAVLGVGFRMIDEVSGLTCALDSLRDRDLILIDTPGFARDEGAAVERLAHLFAGRAEIDVQLVLPATMKFRDLERMLQLYRVFQPQRLMFTRLDETDQIGTAIELAIRAQLPVSFLSGGPRVPEDLEPANASQLARRAFLPAAGGFVRRAAA
jgi:flagellar biosynthesis protein FlhF